MLGLNIGHYTWIDSKTLERRTGQVFQKLLNFCYTSKTSPLLCFILIMLFMFFFILLYTVYALIIF